MYKYQTKLVEFNVDDYSVLNQGWVAKVKAFEDDLKKNILTPEEITARDEQLVVDFYTDNDTEDLEAPELTEAKTKNAILEIKKGIAEITDPQELAELLAKYEENPEIIEYINQRIAKINEETEKAKRKATPPPPTLADKLLSQEYWDYDQLVGLGINPTGQDMTVEGLKLKRMYLFKTYKVMGKV